MKIESLIGHVIEAYEQFAARPQVPADHVLRQFFQSRKYLGSSDRKAIAEGYYGTIKNWLRLEAIAQDVFPTQRTIHPLTVAAYYIALDKVKPAILEDVLRERSFPHEALALMGDAAREAARLASLPTLERIATLHSFPLWIVERLSTEYPAAELEEVLRSLNGEAPTVIRTNTIQAVDRVSLKSELAAEGCETYLGQLAKDALVLTKRVNVMALESFRRGAFEVQDEASQLVAPFAGVEKPTSKVLDACAGAGGKTLHLSAILRNRGEIFATDSDARKLEELRKRVRRSGSQNVRIVPPDEREARLQKIGAAFDLVLLDVPCTGTGTLRRNPSIKWVLTPQMLSEVMAKQRNIVSENIRFVKKGGVLLYATCSLLREEAEGQLEWIESAFPGAFTAEETMRTRPDTHGCDGFFAARLRRTAVPLAAATPAA